MASESNRSDPPKRLLWPIVSITIGLLSLGSGVYCFVSPRGDWRDLTGVLTLPLGLLAMWTGHAGHFKTGYRTGFAGALLGLILFVVPARPGGGPVSLQGAAVGSLRTLNTAEFTYAATYPHGFSPSLSSLAPQPDEKNPPSEWAAGLIDRVLASGQKSGYRFVYSAGLRNEKGRINAYAIWANPIQAGMPCYYTDQTGVIRQNSSRPASATDPPVGG